MTNKEAIDVLKEFPILLYSDEVQETFSKSIEALEKEYTNDWIHGDVPDPEWHRKFEEVEKALGFPLFIWQKTYIMGIGFRQCGKTTAEILRDLLDVDGKPIDYARPEQSKREKFYRYKLRQMKEKLNAAGIPTRPVFFCKEDKVNWGKHHSNEVEECDPYDGTPWADKIMSKYR